MRRRPWLPGIRPVGPTRPLWILSPDVDETFETMTTDRLVLRAATVDDADVLFPITSDPDTWHHAPGGQHRDKQTTREWLARAASRWVTDRLSYWIVRLRDSGETIGVGGVQRQAIRNWNLYYRFAPGAWGNGYATEMGRAAIAAAHATDDSVPVIAWVMEHNQASRHVAEGLGLKDQGPRADPSDGKVRLAFADRSLPPTTPTAAARSAYGDEPVSFCKIAG